MCYYYVLENVIYEIFYASFDISFEEWSIETTKAGSSLKKRNK